MKRLTKQDIIQAFENKTFILPRLTGKQLACQMANELLEYKTIEEELGIDLPTLFKARNGFYAYDEEYDKVIFYNDDLWINIESEMLGGSKLMRAEDNIHFISHSQCDFKDYDKTWALTKEELE